MTRKHTRTHSRTQTRALALSIIIVLSVIAGSFALAGAGAATPSGFVGIPDENIESDLPAKTPMGEAAQDLADAGVMTTDHAETLNITVTSPGRAKELYDGGIYGSGPIAIVLTDDTNHDARKVAIPKAELVDILGYVPPMAYGTHVNGTQWADPIEVESGWVIVETPSYSTNTITWSGNFVYDGDPATDGTSFTYEQNDTASLSNFDINVTGSLATEWDNETANGLTNGDSMSVSLAGTTDPAGPGASNDPVLAVTGDALRYDYNPIYDEGTGRSTTGSLAGDLPDDTAQWTEIQINPDNDGNITSIDVAVGETLGSDYGVSVDVYIVQEVPDGDYAEGTKIATWNPDWSTGVQTISTDEYTVSQGTDYTLEFVSDSSDNDGSKDEIRVHVSDQEAPSDWFWSSDEGAWKEYADVNISQIRRPKTVDVSADTGQSAALGNFTDGETKTTEWALSTSTSSISVSADQGRVDLELQAQEQTETIDPSVEVNGQWTNYTGTLSDGTEAALTTDTAWINGGTNRVNVTVTPSVSADAPAPEVDLYYTHEGTDDTQVTYEGEKFSERYNVSKTYAEDQAEATVEIPFEGSVVAIRDLKYRVNGGSWTSVADADYTLDGTTVNASLTSVTADDTLTVKANASKVAVSNGEIDVTDPTLIGEDLESTISVSARSSGDLGIAVDDSPDAALIHYIHSESWVDDADEYSTFTATDQQTIWIPSVEQGDSFTVTTIPVEVAPQSGGVNIEVENPTSTEPEFKVTPGGTEGDTVKYTFVDATDGEDYMLYSETHDIVRDSGTASSPLTLEDDDSEEVLAFLLESDTSSGSGGSVVVGPTGDASPIQLYGNISLAAIIVTILGGFGLLYLLRQQYGGGDGDGESDVPDTPVPGLGIVAWGGNSILGFVTGSIEGVVDYLRRRPIVGSVVLGGAGLALIAAGVFVPPEGTGIFLLVTAVPLASWLILRRWADQSVLVWVGVNFGAVLIGLQLLGTDLVAIVFESEAGVLLTVGVIGLAYYALKAYREDAQTPDEQTNVEFEIQGEQGGD